MMKLPNFEKAIIRRGKITDYLLSASHPDGRGKSAFFARFGFRAHSWQTLAESLLQHAAMNEASKIETTEFGTRYVIEGELKTPDGRQPLVRVVWFIETDDEIPHLVTAYPL